MKQIEVAVKGSRGWQGRVSVIVFNLDGSVKEITKLVLVNKINTLDLNMMRDALKGDVTDLKLYYMAWGSDNTAPVGGDTALGTEAGRKLITLQATGGTGILTTTTYIAPTEAVGTIEELGWFAGPDAASDADSGLLVGRVLYSRVKTNLESLQIVRTDTFSEV